MSRLNADQQRVKDLVEVFNTPIAFHPGGWEDTLPEWLRGQVIAERVTMVCNGGWDKATDAEVTCYLYTASLSQPLGSDWTAITIHQAAKQLPQLYQVLPDTPKELSDYQKSELNDLKRKIRHSQLRRRKSNRKEKDMSKRKLVLEEHDADVLVGIMQDACDPVIRTVEGTLEDALAAVPDFLKEAQEKWAVQPKNPAYKPPVLPKPTPAPAAQPPKAEDLPLLSGTEEGKPKVEEQAPEPAAVAPAPPAAETKPEAVGLHVPEDGNLVSQPEGEVAEAVAEVTEPPAAPAAVEPESTAVPTEPSEPVKPGEWEYYLQDGRGPYKSVQEAMDEMGLDKNTRPTHNRWDRLSTALKEKIQRRAKQPVYDGTG